MKKQIISLCNSLYKHRKIYADIILQAIINKEIVEPQEHELYKEYEFIGYMIRYLNQYKLWQLQ